MARAEEIAIIALFPSYLPQNNGLVDLEYPLIQSNFESFLFPFETYNTLARQ